jgi:hypothetical protein
MTEITGELVIGIVFGGGLLYAFFQIFTGLARQFGWREFAIDFGGILLIGILLVVASAYVVGTYYLSKELTSSVRLATVLWILLMLLPTAVYAGVANKFITPGKGKKSQVANTGEKKQETERRSDN